MGSYEREQQMIADKTASRGETVRRYFAELDAQLNEETSHLSHRPDYSKTLFAPENDDIDGAAVYNMLVKLRTQPEIANKVLNFRPTCYQGGCGSKDAGFDLGYYD